MQDNQTPGMQPESTLAYLSLGSNMGDRLVYLREALHHLERQGAIEVEKISSVYETDPVGLVDQPAFLNIAIRIRTTLSPTELLHYCQSVEDHFQRERYVRWGPRTLDIDLLTFDDLILNTAELTLPHPRMHEREFVLIPLHELETGEIGCSEGVRPLYTHWYLH
jgi:2-amino-4-hydroxy-6-hydroxymethyldihydropteridine diphosphokinase